MDYFSQFGAVSESRLVKDKRTKKFRGFGFVTFEDSSVVDEVMDIKTHKICNKKVELKRAYTKEQTREKLLDEKMRKLYIIGIPKELLISDI
jgi:RNA recognition motif-containing protein